MVMSETGIRPKRKSRGRGLRATTGCIICKRRHVKCDEERPQCGPCKIGSRSCAYSHEPQIPPDSSKPLPAPTAKRNNEQRTVLLTPSPSGSSVAAIQVPTETRWQRTCSTVSCASPHLNDHYYNQRRKDSEHRQNFEFQVPRTVTNTTNSPGAWRVSEKPIPIFGLDLFLLHHFVHVVSKLLDFHDPEMHFTRTVPQLALRNMGLKKALLALSARHFALKGSREDGSTDEGQKSTIYHNTAVEYYTDSIQYMNSAMQSPSDAQSLALTAAALFISTYEMIGGRYQNWQKRVQGMFWLQKFQETHGDSGGLSSAIWWAWFQQDTWIAMREGRRTYSFWEPQRQIDSLTAPELARHASYLLAQCVNYISPDEGKEDLTQRAERGNELLRLLQEWRDATPPDYYPLPLTSNDIVFPMIWVNPSSYGAALQVQSLALILVVLHHPSLGATGNDQRSKDMLITSVNTICGIARSVYANDLGANFTSLNCLYGAAICVQDPHERLALLDLLDSCQDRLQWPVESLRKELELNYSKHAFHGLLEWTH